MLKIIKSSFSSSGREKMYEEIKRLSDLSKKSILIVPEQQTVLAEGVMAEILPPSSALVFEVTNFTRLANTTFRTLGGISGEYCDGAKKALIMWRTLSELAPMLRVTQGRREISVGLVESSLAAVGEMQNLGILPNELASCVELEAVKRDERLSAKLTDLAKIYTLYKSILSEKYSDSANDVDVMLEKLEQHSDFLSDTAIFIDGFTSFTEGQYRLIGTLAKRSDVSVILTIPSYREGAFEFAEIRGAKERLLNSARRKGADVKMVKEEGFGKKSKESLAQICDLLWTTNTDFDNISLQNSEELRIFEAQTPFEECSFICEDIKRRVMNGASYSDFAIITRSLDKYSGILDGALERAKIPAFLSYRKDIGEFEAIKLIYTAYSVMRGFSREDVITYAKCALSGISREECDEFETYVNKWQVSGKRFTDGEVWSMNPLGYTVLRPEGTDEKLRRINETKAKIINPLLAFAKDVNAAKTVKEHAVALLNFLIKIDMESSLKKRAADLSALGECALAEENSRLWGVICDSLDTLVSVLDDFSADSECFLAQLKVVFGATDIAKIPAHADEVTVGDADMIRLYEKPHVYLIGVNAGQFPMFASDNSYFSERDKLTLMSSGLNFQPDLEIKGARELYIFSRAFSYATESVTLSYSATDTRYKSIEPSEVISRISKLTANQVKTVKILDLPIEERLFTPECALEDIDSFAEHYDHIKSALISSGYGEKVGVSEGSIINSTAQLGQSVIEELYGSEMRLSQSRIDTYVGCPFAHFCRYTIGLSEDERAEFDAPSIGSFIHAILENFFRELSLEGRKSGELTEDERRDLTLKAAKKYISELGEDALNASKRTEIKIDRLCRAALPVVDGLCEEFRESLYEPRFFELSLSDRSEDSPGSIRLRNDESRVRIYGIIDRVDAFKRGDDVYLRVIDYKTGHKEFSPDDIAEGLNLQMFLYLKALVDSENQRFRDRCGVGDRGRLIPGGVIYVKTSVGDVKIDTPDDALALEAIKAAQHREGMLLDDNESISAMVLKHTPLYSKRYPDKISEDKKKYLYTEQGWEEIMETVEKTVLDISERMRSGEISAKPKRRKKQSPCEYCEFKAICRKVEK